MAAHHGPVENLLDAAAGTVGGNALGFPNRLQRAQNVRRVDAGHVHSAEHGEDVSLERAEKLFAVAGIAPALGILVEVALGGFAESQLARRGEFGGGLGSLLLFDRVDLVGEQLSGGSCAIPSIFQTEVGNTAKPEPALAAIKFVAQHPAFGAAG